MRIIKSSKIRKNNNKSVIILELKIYHVLPKSTYGNGDSMWTKNVFNEVKISYRGLNNMKNIIRYFGCAGHAIFLSSPKTKFKPWERQKSITVPQDLENMLCCYYQGLSELDCLILDLN